MNNIRRIFIQNLSKNTNFITKSNYVTASTDNSLVKSIHDSMQESKELDELYKKVIIEVRGHDPSVLESYEKFVKMTAQELELNLRSIKTPFRFIERWTILKSRFSNRKHMRQYEMRTHFKEFEFIHLTGSTHDVLLEYIQRNLPEGVAMHVHRTKILNVPEEFNQN